jgi:hypothetical protein
LAFLLQGLELPGDLNSTVQKLVRVEIRQMGKWICAFRRQGLEEFFQCSRG